MIRHIHPAHAVLGTLRYGLAFWRYRQWTGDCKQTYERLRSIDHGSGGPALFWRHALPALAFLIGTAIAEAIA